MASERSGESGILAAFALFSRFFSFFPRFFPPFPAFSRLYHRPSLDLRVGLWRYRPAVPGGSSEELAFLPFDRLPSTPMSSSNQLLVVGSVAIDWIITPDAERSESVGGSATYFGMAASYHCPVSLVGVVGADFPAQACEDLARHGVCLQGLERVEAGKTFRWKGRYHDNMNHRDTLDTQLHCFEAFDPKLPASYRDADYLFLANIQPKLQLAVLEQMHKKPDFVGLDTMNLWIEIASEDLKRVLTKVDLLVINDEEAAQLTGEKVLVRAAQKIQEMGPSYVVIKRGEFGAVMFGRGGEVFAVPAFLLDQVFDPTGAGDCFAGGLMGYLAAQDRIDENALRRGVAWGSVMASFCVEGFSYDGLKDRSESEIAARYQRFVDLTRF